MRAQGLAVGSSHLLEIILDHRHITLTVEIPDVSDERLLHARFVNPPGDAHWLIDEYISTFR